MSDYIALLRAVNVAGRNMISMERLRELAEDVGFDDVKTLLQSGNLVFRNRRKIAGSLMEGRLEKETAKRLNMAVDYFVRSARELKMVIDENPFPKEGKKDPGHLVVMFLKSKPDPKSVTELQKAIQGREVVRAVGTQLYIVYPDGIGRSKLTTGLIEKKLGTRGTGRNWNTVLKLAAMTTAPGTTGQKASAN